MEHNKSMLILTRISLLHISLELTKVEIHDKHLGEERFQRIAVNMLIERLTASTKNEN